MPLQAWCLTRGGATIAWTAPGGAGRHTVTSLLIASESFGDEVSVEEEAKDLVTSIRSKGEHEYIYHGSGLQAGSKPYYPDTLTRTTVTDQLQNLPCRRQTKSAGATTS